MTSGVDDLATTHQATISIWMGGTDGSLWVSRDSDVVHHPASTVKLPLLVALYRAADATQLSLDEEIPVRDRLPSARPDQTYLTTQDYDQDDAVWDRLGSTASLRWLGERAIVRSSNLATNLLIDRLGIEAVNAVFDDLGTPASRLARGIQDLPGADAGLESTATAVDLAAVLRGVAARTAASPSACVQMEDVLARCEDQDRLPAGLPPGTYVAHKSGWIDSVSHDVGIIRPQGEEPFVLAIMTWAPLDEAAGSRLVADVAACCWLARHELAASSRRIRS